jgi:hypothetical protein
MDARQEDGTPELWLPIPNWDGFYSASDLGRIRSESRVVLNRDGNSARVRGRVLTTRVEGAYEKVTLHRGTRRSNYSVHRLVLEAHVGPRPEGMVCCHGPGGSLDNRLLNLSWGTHHKNLGEDRLRDGTHSRGERNGGAVLQECEVLAIRADPRRTVDVAEDYGISCSTVRKIRRGESWAWLA